MAKLGNNATPQGNTEHSGDSPISTDIPQDASQETYADLIVNYLYQINIDYIFGVPGGAIEPLYNAIARHARNTSDDHPDLNYRSSIPRRRRQRAPHLSAVIARHEAGAAFMADGYARETGKLGVCCATTGPGATNLITGVASAFSDRIPMLVITPQTALPNFGKAGLQESSADAVDVVGMFEHCTHYNSMVSHPDQLEGKLYTALINAFRRPRGPVHLSIPMDIMNMPASGKFGNYHIAHHFRQPKFKDDASYEIFKESLNKSQRVVFCMGGGCSNIHEKIFELAERLNAEVISTPSGKKWAHPYHALYRGVFGFAGHVSAQLALEHEDVDMIVAVGTSLGELATSGWSEALLNERLVHITNTYEDLTRSPMACLHIMGNLRTVFDDLLEDVPQANNNVHLLNNIVRPRSGQYIPANITVEDAAGCLEQQDALLKPQYVMRELAERFPDSSRYLIDAGNAWAWATHYLLNTEPGAQRIAFGFGAMGWAIGAAVGTALGNQEVTTICITGDGSYLMSGQEISTVVQHKLPVIYVVLNDRALGMVKHGQRMGGGEPIGFELPAVDFAAMARATGADGITIKSSADFEALDINALCSGTRPVLLDIHIDGEEVPPIGSRLKTLRDK